METVSMVIISGLAVVAVAQVVGSIISFRFSFAQGLLAVIIPGYLLVVLKRGGAYGSVVGIWAVGVALLVVGTALSS